MLPPAPGAHLGEKSEKTVAGTGSWHPYPHFHPIKKQGEASVSPIPSAGTAGEGEPSIFSSLKAPTRLLQWSRSTWMKQHPSEFANAARRLWNTSNVFSPFPVHDCSIISSSLDLFKQAFRCSSNGSHLGPSADMLFIYCCSLTLQSQLAGERQGRGHEDLQLFACREELVEKS